MRCLSAAMCALDSPLSEERGAHGDQVEDGRPASNAQHPPGVAQLLLALRQAFKISRRVVAERTTDRHLAHVAVGALLGLLALLPDPALDIGGKGAEPRRVEVGGVGALTGTLALSPEPVLGERDARRGGCAGRRGMSVRGWVLVGDVRDEDTHSLARSPRASAPSTRSSRRGAQRPRRPRRSA